jgi:predicted nuclease with TOPRIM domain
MVTKTVVVLSLVCVILAVGLAGVSILLVQKDAELQIKTNQVSELENEKLSLTSQVSPLQNQVSSLQDNVTALETEKSTLETQVSVLQTNVSALQNNITALEDENNVLVSQVSPLQTQVSSLEDEVASLEDDKALLEQQISALQTNVASLQNQVTSLDYEKDSLEIQVASLTTEVANLEAEVIISYNEGYAQGADDLIQTGYYTMDPTYDQAISFIESDETDQNEYTPEYVCYDFTADFSGNATQEGYRCGFVYIEFVTGAHAIACFNTTDMGLIFVEPQNDNIVDVAVGEMYQGRVIVKMGIIW